MRKRLIRFLAWLHRKLVQPPKRSPEEQAQLDTIRAQQELLNEAATREAQHRADYVERVAELVEARAMAGTGPWLVAESRESAAKGTVAIRESNPITSQGAFGDIELALQNVEWRREINLSWLEFSRWGIQQIILISRLYYIKNPIVRRLIDICAVYVFGRGVEVSSDDEAANEVLKEFFEANKSTLGQIALVDLEKRKYYDGNLFFAFFSDTADTGSVSVRNIDATEIQDIIANPDDSDRPWFYRREWVQRNFDPQSGTVATVSMKRWYPAMGYEPTARPKTIGGVDVAWETPILHRKCGGVAKWHFGCPTIYPAIDWAKAAKKFLEHCATVRAALAQIAMTVTTKGGQQALEGVKQQLQTSVGPTSSLWDQNPTAVAGAVFGSGPGTKLEAFNTRGGGGDMADVRPLIRMCCMVCGVPETFMSDTDIGQLATATSLDRPTELYFMEKQEAWREDLVTIAMWVLTVSKQAPSGKFRNALQVRKLSPSDIDHLDVREAARKRTESGAWIYDEAAAKKAKAANKISVRATFPSIREGDQTVLINGVVAAMTLGNKSGEVIGIDEKEGVRRLYELAGFENADEMVELMYPEGDYDPDRTAQEEPEPTPAPEVAAQPPLPTPKQREMARRLVREAIASESD